MEIRTQINENNQLTVELRGRLDTVNAKMFESEMQENILSSAHLQVILECKGLDYISSSGLRLLLTLKKESDSRGGSMVLRNVQPAVMAVFQMTGFDKVLTIES